MNIKMRIEVKFDLEWLRRAIQRQPHRREELINAQREFEKRWLEG